MEPAFTSPFTEVADTAGFMLFNRYKSKLFVVAKSCSNVIPFASPKQIGGRTFLLNNVKASRERIVTFDDGKEYRW